MGEAIALAAEASDLDDETLASELHAWFRAWVSEGFFLSTSGI